MIALQLFAVVFAVFVAFPLLLVIVLRAAVADTTMFPEFSRDEQRQREAEFFVRHGLPPSGGPGFRSGVALNSAGGEMTTASRSFLGVGA